MPDKENSSDEFKAPEWLNKDFFENALIKFKKDETIIVLDVELSPVKTTSQHYTSIMFRAEITYASRAKRTIDEVIKLILKTLNIQEGIKMEMMKKSTAFKTEMKMYEEILPKMQQLFDVIDEGKTRIAPTLVYQSDEPAPVIILIDETTNGFEPYRESLNLAQVQAAVERIAKFHAVSMFMNDNVSSSEEKLRNLQL